VKIKYSTTKLKMDEIPGPHYDMDVFLLKYPVEIEVEKIPDEEEVEIIFQTACEAWLGWLTCYNVWLEKARLEVKPVKLVCKAEEVYPEVYSVAPIATPTPIVDLKRYIPKNELKCFLYFPFRNTCTYHAKVPIKVTKDIYDIVVKRCNKTEIETNVEMYIVLYNGRVWTEFKKTWKLKVKYPPIKHKLRCEVIPEVKEIHPFDKIRVTVRIWVEPTPLPKPIKKLVKLYVNGEQVDQFYVRLKKEIEVTRVITVPDLKLKPGRHKIDIWAEVN